MNVDALMSIGAGISPIFTTGMILLGLLIGGYIIWESRSLKAAIIATGIMSAFLESRAGDALEQIGRYDTTRGVRDTASAANDWMGTHQLEALNFVYHFGSSGSTPRETAGALLGGLNAASGGYDQLYAMPGSYGSVAAGPLSGYHYTTVCEF